MKPGFKTTEFIVNACVIVGAVAFAVADKLPARYAAIAAAISAGAYAVSRGLAKVGPPNPPTPGP